MTNEQMDFLDVATYRVANVYGQRTMYPVSDIARMACDLAGTKTLTSGIIRTLESYGFTVEQVAVLA